MQLEVSTSSITVNDKHNLNLEDYVYILNGALKIRQSCRMRKKGNNRGMIEYKTPVDIRDKENSVVTALFKPYKVVNT